LSGATHTKKLKPGKTTAFFICLCVAAFLWFVKAINSNYTLSVKIPVEFIHLPTAKKPLRALPQMLEVQIRTSGIKLFLIKFNQPFSKMVIDMNNLSASNRNYVLSASTLPFKNILKFETIIKHVNPDTLYFTDKHGTQKNVPVKLMSSVNFAPGFGCTNILVEPAFITITGDSSLIRNTDTLYTSPLNEMELSKDLSRELSIIVPNSNVYLDQNTVNIRMKVARLLEKEIYVPVSVTNAPEEVKSIQLFPARVKLKITYLQDEFNLADTANFKAAVDAGTIKHGKASVFLSTKPGNVNVLSIKPATTELIMLKK
jgi:YbbR domain-containing protein